jgi:TRAP-type C4-dicarboxylate transport system permease large subunit
MSSVMHIFKGAYPFLICAVILLALITIFPEIALWLPGVIGR